MSTIEELQGRIVAAMDRIGSGLEVLSHRPEPEPAAPEPDMALIEALEEEKLANAQLKERLRMLNQKHLDAVENLQAQLADNSEATALRDEMARQNDILAKLDADLQRLRMANDQLRQSNAALREANEAGVGEPHLINKAMLAELEALRATRAADASEAAVLLARLEPMLAADATTQEGGV